MQLVPIDGIGGGRSESLFPRIEFHQQIEVLVQVENHGVEFLTAQYLFQEHLIEVLGDKLRLLEPLSSRFRRLDLQPFVLLVEGMGGHDELDFFCIFRVAILGTFFGLFAGLLHSNLLFEGSGFDVLEFLEVLDVLH